MGMGIKGKKIVVFNLNYREEVGNLNWLFFYLYYNENNDLFFILSIRDRVFGNYCVKVLFFFFINLEWIFYVYELFNLNIIC